MPEFTNTDIYVCIKPKLYIPSLYRYRNRIPPEKWDISTFVNSIPSNKDRLGLAISNYVRSKQSSLSELESSTSGLRSL
jgi:hypothetical protein